VLLSVISHGHRAVLQVPSNGGRLWLTYQDECCVSSKLKESRA
jgi:hypothetical protein